MKRLLYITILFTLSSLFIGCATQTATFNNKTKLLTINIDHKNKKELLFTTPIVNNNGGHCILNHFAVAQRDVPQYGDIFVEHISIDTNCEWNGLAEGYFSEYMKKYFNIKSVKKLDIKKIGKFEFSTYLLDNYLKIKMIEIWGPKENTFIFDKLGFFSDELEKTLIHKNTK